MLVSLPKVQRHDAPSVLSADAPEALARAAQSLRSGNPVALPTETVYGLAAMITNDSAIAKVFRVKGRPASHPLIAHVDNVDRSSVYAERIPTIARDAMEAFWPGPLTVLLDRSKAVSDLVTGGRNTVALRCPANVFFRRVVETLDTALVAPSANRFGHVSPTRAEHVRADLGSQIDLIIDGGDSVLGLESTIIDFTVARPQVLRHGALPQEEIEETLDITLDAPRGPSRASGMLESHYAPRARVRLVNDDDEALAALDELAEMGVRSRLLEYAHDLPMYAATLYQQLRQADGDGIAMVVAILPPQRGLGAALVDRLRKAAITPFEATAEPQKGQHAGLPSTQRLNLQRVLPPETRERR